MIYASIADSYYKDLLSSDDFYVREKVRFEGDYKKFNIKPENLGAYFKRFKARKDERDIDKLT